VAGRKRRKELHRVHGGGKTPESRQKKKENSLKRGKKSTVACENRAELYRGRRRAREKSYRRLIYWEEKRSHKGTKLQNPSEEALSMKNLEKKKKNGEEKKSQCRKGRKNFGATAGRRGRPFAAWKREQTMEGSYAGKKKKKKKKKNKVVGLGGGGVLEGLSDMYRRRKRSRVRRGVTGKKPFFSSKKEASLYSRKEQRGSTTCRNGSGRG